MLCGYFGRVVNLNFRLSGLNKSIGFRQWCLFNYFLETTYIGGKFFGSVKVKSIFDRKLVLAGGNF